MTLSNSQVVENWTQGIDSASKHVFSEDNFLYSYGRHFVMAIRCKDGFIMNKNKYSQTTSCHQGLVRRNIAGNIWEVDFKLMNDVAYFLGNWHVGLLDETTIDKIKTRMMLERL